MIKLKPRKKIPMDTFSAQTREEVLIRDGYRCVCKCGKCNGVAHSIHHVIPNTKANRKRYGNLLQNKVNGASTSFYCHGNCVYKFKELQKSVQAVFDTMIAENADIINASQEEINVVLNKYKKIIGEIE